MTEVLAARLGVDPDRDPRPGLIAAVAWAAFATAVARWVASDGRENLPALVDQALQAVGAGLEQRPPTRSTAASKPTRARPPRSGRRGRHPGWRDQRSLATRLWVLPQKTRRYLRTRHSASKVFCSAPRRDGSRPARRRPGTRRGA
jgi:hypothetical protein